MASPTPPSADPATPEPEAIPDPGRPTAECDIVMQGGTASGVIYPRALVRLASRYRLRGVGGTSAGAIAAAVAAAAEYGRTTGRGGFDGLAAVPQQLSGGQLLALFRPTRQTRPLMAFLLGMTGGDRPDGRSGVGRVIAALGALLAGYPWAGVLGLLPGVIVIVLGVIAIDPWAMVLGVVLLVVLTAATLTIALIRALTRAVPQNSFGICTGMSEPGTPPALTEWLSGKINAVAGLDPHGPPLTFGRLWTSPPPDSAVDIALASAAAAGAAERRIDLRVITTCLSEARPYELPFSSSQFFYDPAEWRRLFPPEVMDALDAAPDPRVPAGADPLGWRTDSEHAGGYGPALRRLPDAEYLPVVVAARMSLSLPLVISAVPLWMVTRTDVGPDGRLDPTGPREFVKVWFSDGGLATNFPVQLFDSALPTRPTYAINLQPFPPGVEPDPADPTAGVEWARNNRDGIAPIITRWPGSGLGALTGFLGAMFRTARTWQDNTQLAFPGFRDRIVRVLRAPREGGINLAMDPDTIERLARRGEYAITELMDQFEEPHYPPLADGQPTGTGWDNHRWVRYRAVLSVLPGWAASYARGREGLGDGRPAAPPSYPFGSDRERELAERLDEQLSRLAGIVADADPEALAGLTARPRPVGVIRRIPRI